MARDKKTKKGITLTWYEYVLAFVYLGGVGFIFLWLIFAVRNGLKERNIKIIK